MSEVAVESVDVVALKAELAAANEALTNALNKPPKPPSRVKAKLVTVYKSIWAGLTSTAAVKAEKSVAVIVVTRLLVSTGAGVGAVSLVEAVLKALGVTN